MIGSLQTTEKTAQARRSFVARRKKKKKKKKKKKQKKKKKNADFEGKRKGRREMNALRSASDCSLPAWEWASAWIGVEVEIQRHCAPRVRAR